MRPLICLDCKDYYFAYACFHPLATPKDGTSKHKTIDCAYTTKGGTEPHPFDGVPSWCPLGGR